MSWRKWNRIIHRDLGYLCAGLTLIYAISGIAVNHIRDWNPNYDIEYVESTIEPVTETFDDTNVLAAEILKRLDIHESYRNTYLPDPQTIEIFLDGNTITANYHTGRIQQEIVKNRPFLRQFNFLHLNEARRLWTYFADLFAACLIVVAISGLFILRGPKGITGRGAWLTAIGFLVPLIFFFIYF